MQTPPCSAAHDTIQHSMAAAHSSTACMVDRQPEVATTLVRCGVAQADCHLLKVAVAAVDKRADGGDGQALHRALAAALGLLAGLHGNNPLGQDLRPGACHRRLRVGPPHCLLVVCQHL